MDLLINVLIGAVIALVVYFVATALVAFPHSILIIGLICLVIFLVIAFRGGALWGSRTRRPPPTV